MNNQLRLFVSDVLCVSNIRNAGFLNPDIFTNLDQLTERQKWHAFVFQIWYEKWEFKLIKISLNRMFLFKDMDGLFFLDKDKIFNDKNIHFCGHKTTIGVFVYIQRVRHEH